MKSNTWKHSITLLAVLAVAVLGAGNALADQISTTVTISATPGTTVPEGTIVTLTGNVLCTGTQHTCPTPPIGGKIQIQMLELEGVPVACGTEGAEWSDHIEGGDGEAPDASGNVSADFDTDGFGGQTIGFRAHYVTPGGGHSPATNSSDCLDIIITVEEQGCSHGFWKSHDGSGPQPSEWPSPYTPTTTLGIGGFVFPAELSGYTFFTFEMALDFTGGPGVNGAAEILLRNAVASLLNAEHPDVDYPMTAQEVRDAVNDALDTADRDTMLELEAELDILNNLGCPLPLEE